MTSPNPLDSIEHHRFEELIAKLMVALGFENVEHFQYGADRGRDITATKNEEFALNRTRVISVRVQCKHYKGKSVSISALARCVAQFEAAVSDRQLIIFVSSWLTSDTRDWINEQSNRIGRDIIYYEKNEILTFLTNFPELMEEFLPSKKLLFEAAQSAHYFINQQLENDNFSEKIPEIVDRNLAWRDRATFAYLNQHHKMTYQTTGVGTRELKFSMINLSNRNLGVERFTFFGNSVHSPLSDLVVSASVSGVPIEIKYDDISDLPQEKVIMCEFDEIKPLQIIEVSVSFNWPFSLPIIGHRYYAMSVLRPTRRLSFEVVCPNGLRKVHRKIVCETGMLSDHVYQNESGPEDENWYGIISCPSLNSMYRLYFDLEEI